MFILILVLTPAGLDLIVSRVLDAGLPVPREVAMPKTGLGFNWLLNLASPMIAIGTYQSPGWPTLDICYLPLYFGAALPNRRCSPSGNGGGAGGRGRWPGRVCFYSGSPSAAPSPCAPGFTIGCPRCASPAIPVGRHVIRYRADDLFLRVVCPHTGFLLPTDRWSRSWTARVNGQPVPVAAGENLVEMRFEPPGVYPMLALSWTLLAVAVGSVWQIVRRRKKILVPAVSGTRLAPLELTVCAAS